MQDQGKRLLVAVALALGVMFAWQALFAPEPPPKKPDATEAGSAVPPGETAAVAPDQVPVPTEEPPRACEPDEQIRLTFPNLEASFCRYGGILDGWHLTDSRYDRDKSKGNMLPQQPGAGAFGVSFPNSTFTIPAGAEWTGTRVSDREVTYTLETSGLQLEKKFVLYPEVYAIKATITVRAKVPAGSEARQTLAISVYGFQDPKDDGGGGQSIAPRRWDSATYRAGELVATSVGSVQTAPRFEYGINWTGFEHAYMLVAIAPQTGPGQTAWKKTVAQGSEGLMRTDIMLAPPQVFKPDSGPVVHEAMGYLGPKNYKELEAADEIAGYATGFRETIDMGWFAFIGRPLMWLLLKFYAFFQNWGLAIVLLTIVVKSLTVPFTTKSMRSMKAMAVLAPQLKALQEKYKHDRQRLQMETMALYKQHGANPLTGCLPLVLQMPIWLALYRMLSSTGELYQQPFIPGWIDDLTYSDPYYVLPIVLMVTMFLQARITPMAPATDPTQKLQQRMMQYGLPLMFGVMSFFFPAGLTLYIFTNTILSALHSIYMNKFDKKSIELAAKIKEAQEAAKQQKDQAAAAKAKDANPPKDDGSDEGGAEKKPTVRPRQGPRNKPRKKRRR